MPLWSEPQGELGVLGWHVVSSLLGGMWCPVCPRLTWGLAFATGLCPSGDTSDLILGPMGLGGHLEGEWPSCARQVPHLDTTCTPQPLKPPRALLGLVSPTGGRSDLSPFAGGPSELPTFPSHHLPCLLWCTGFSWRREVMGIPHLLTFTLRSPRALAALHSRLGSRLCAQGLA